MCQQLRNIMIELCNKINKILLNGHHCTPVIYPLFILFNLFAEAKRTKKEREPNHAHAQKHTCLTASELMNLNCLYS